MQMITENECSIDVKQDIRNNYSYNKWIDSQSDQIDEHSYSLCYTDGSEMRLSLTENTNLKDDLSVERSKTTNMKYRFSNRVYDLSQQIPMIKLFIAVLIARKYVECAVDDCLINTNSEDNKGTVNGINRKIKFLFNLYNDETGAYDKRIDIVVDDRIIVDDSKKPIVIDSESMLDHLLLKAFIKLSNIMKVSIKDINVNSLVAVCRGGRLYKLSLDSQSSNRLQNSEFTVTSLLNDSSPNMVEKERQSTWISNNIMKAILGEDTKPYNNYAKLLFELFSSEMVLGVTVNESFLYYITGLTCDQVGGMCIMFYNIFTGKDVSISFETVAYGLNQIGVIVA
ncbi:hypothetical protein YASMINEVIRUS_949 [Yasminevirus sp. GU-2018]|uniref:Uncharacterized protein n=1 Tax=Yasminevirus sp. GU-2018 TaxID=2420051 RepID=A0A5K0UBK7_9VIRU|nr:hypothetical protein YASMINEVIRUS_949 [Yasminevirus sp. GU-2018]